MIKQTFGYFKARFELAREEGATAVEYGIMVALIAVVIIAAVAAIGTALKSDFQCTADSLKDNADKCS